MRRQAGDASDRGSISIGWIISERFVQKPLQTLDGACLAGCPAPEP
jgi:hypothetical protein